MEPAYRGTCCIVYYYAVVQLVSLVWARGPSPNGGAPKRGGERVVFIMKQKAHYFKGDQLKNGSFPQDMLVLSIMTLSVDLLRQIATDPHGFSRPHSIENGLFNFPQGVLSFPFSFFGQTKKLLS